MAGPRLAQGERDLGAFGGGCLSEARAQAGRAGVDLELRPRLRIGERQDADGRQRQLARVADLDDEDLVASGQRAQRAGPGLRIAQQVGDDHHETAPQPAAAGARSPMQRLGTRVGGGAGPLLGPRRRGQDAQRVPERVATAAGRRLGDAERRPVPCTTVNPKRLPSRVVSTPNAVVVASARSRFSQVWVPKCIDAVRSTTAYVVSSRSAMRSLTCGTLVRAVTAQSMRRTSSPSRYSRLSARSLPCPGSSPR